MEYASTIAEITKIVSIPSFVITRKKSALAAFLIPTIFKIDNKNIKIIAKITGK